jgi:hypothetical protein
MGILDAVATSLVGIRGLRPERNKNQCAMQSLSLLLCERLLGKKTLEAESSRTQGGADAGSP